MHFKQHTYQVFGSPTSQDYDIIVFVDNIPSIQACKILCTNFEKPLQLIFRDKPLNINIAIAQNGVIIDCFKGIKDELNNSLLHTYAFHEQHFPNHIHHQVERDVTAKILRAFRIITSHLSRTPYRKAIKAALKGDLNDKIEVLQTIDWLTLIAFEKGNPTDIYKSIAFQIGQTLALIHGVECFSKQAILDFMITQHINFEVYLKRQPLMDFTALEKGIEQLCTIVASEFKDILHLNEKLYSAI